MRRESEGPERGEGSPSDDAEVRVTEVRVEKAERPYRLIGIGEVGEVRMSTRLDELEADGMASEDAHGEQQLGAHDVLAPGHAARREAVGQEVLVCRQVEQDRKSTRLNSSHLGI